MARLTRKLQKLFGDTAGANNMATQFGSLAAAAPSRTTGALSNVTQIQSLSEWSEGWISAVLGLNALAIEDLNALHYSENYQLAYILQLGIPEYSSTTEYTQGSVIQTNFGDLAVSLINTSTGNDPVTSGDWMLTDSTGGFIRSKTVNYALLNTDGYVRFDTTSGALSATLPDLATVTLGKVYTVKNISTGGNALTVLTFSGSQFVDGMLSIDLTGSTSGGVNNLPSLKVRKVSNTAWDII